MTQGQGASIRRLFEFLLTDHGLRTYSDLARHMGIDRSTVSNLAQGKIRLKAHHILFIHEYFGVEVWKIRELSGQYDTAKEEAGLQAGSVQRKTEEAMITHKKSGATP